MSKLPVVILVFFSLIFKLSPITAQDNTLATSSKLIPTYLQNTLSKANSLNDKLDKRSQKVLQRLQRQEARIKQKLSRIGSSAASKMSSDASVKYKQLEDRLSDPNIKGGYISSLDTMLSSVKFLSQVKGANEKFTETLEKVKGLQSEFQKAEALKEFLKERNQYLKEQITKFGFVLNKYW